MYIYKYPCIYYCRCFGGAEGAFEDGLLVALRL